MSSSTGVNVKLTKNYVDPLGLVKLTINILIHGEK
jgi:hypothetical protein